MTGVVKGGNICYKENMSNWQPKLLLLAGKNEEERAERYLRKKFGYPKELVVAVNSGKGKEVYPKMDLIRDWQEELGLRGGRGEAGEEGRGKPAVIYLISNIDLAGEGVQNALLKILEEPPVGVLIVLTAKEEGEAKILTTIYSRVKVERIEKGEEEEENEELWEIAMKLSEGKMAAGEIIQWIEAEIKRRGAGNTDEEATKTQIERRAGQELIEALSRIFYRELETGETRRAEELVRALEGCQRAINLLGIGPQGVGVKMVLEDCFFRMMKG